MNETPTEGVWSTPVWGDEPSSLPELDPGLAQLLLEHVATRVAVVNIDRRYVYANRQTLEFMGRPPEQVIGRHMADVLDPLVYAQIKPLFDRAFAGEQLLRRAWATYDRQGRRFREQWYVPYRGNGIDVTAVVVCGVDQTAQRLVEAELASQSAALRTSEALKSAIFDHALVAFVTTDADGLIVEFNPAAEAMFGQQRAAVIGVPVSMVMIPERFRSAHDQGMRRMRDGAPARVMGRRLEMHAARADGSEFPMEMVLWRTDAEGRTFYTASISDLSQRHGAAQQIERQRDALRQSEKLTAMGSLLAGVAHELNNPLAVVMGRASLLEEKCTGRALLDDARRIREAAERCGRIVRTFLNMARSRPARREPTSLNDAARAAVDMLGYSYRSHDIEMRVDMDPQLPDVLADPDQLCQILLNLLVNAQQALALVQGTRRVTVTSGTRACDRAPAGAVVWLRVADNGTGVAPEVQARLFEPFFTTKAEGLGTGMGLAVSRTLAREHGGELVLDAAAPAGGASFCLTLPQPLPEAVAGHDGAVEADDVFLGRILVVDDEAELALVMREMLESVGYEVAAADSGAVALALLDTAHFDAILCDLRMPDMDGASLCQHVAAAYPALARRLLFVTGDTLSADAVALFRQSGCEGLDKPFTKAELLSRVSALIGPRAADLDPA